MTDPFIYGPLEASQAESGAADLTFRTNRVPDEVLIAQQGNRHLKNRGGKGDKRIALVGDAVLTIEESLAVVLAKDIIDDAQRRHSKTLKELTLIELNFGLEARCKGRACTPEQVGAEIARIQNVAIYGNTLRRR